MKKNVDQLKLSCQIEGSEKYILSLQYSSLPKSETIVLRDSSNVLMAEIGIDINKDSLRVYVIRFGTFVTVVNSTIQLYFEISDDSFLNSMNKVLECKGETSIFQGLQMPSEILTRLPGGVFHIVGSTMHEYFLYDGKAEEYKTESYVFNFSTQTITARSILSRTVFTVYYDEPNIPYVTLNSLTLNYNGEAKLSYTQSSSFINNVHYSY